MAKLRVLMEKMAELTGQPFTSIEMHARPLRKARLLSTGAKGVNAPEVVASDITNLVIAILRESPTHAATLVPETRNFTAAKTCSAITELLDLSDGHRFGDAMDAFIMLFSDPAAFQRMKAVFDKHQNTETTYICPNVERISFGDDTSIRIVFGHDREEDKFSCTYIDIKERKAPIEFMRTASMSMMHFWTELGKLLRT
ncbi:MAG: hypothetical protein WCO00_08880 [Rhodospirillaceae bacterium]